MNANHAQLERLSICMESEGVKMSLIYKDIL